MSCKTNPDIRTADGKLVESELYSQLYSTYKNRVIATSLYRMTKDKNFMRTNEELFELDKNGEPTIQSFSKVLLREKVIEGENLAETFIKLKQDKLYDTIDQVLPKIEDYNNLGLPMMATYTKEGKFYKISILPKTSTSTQTTEDLELGKKAMDTIINGLLSPMGYSYKSVNKYATIHGFGDPLNAQAIAEDIKALKNYASGAFNTAHISVGTAYFLIENLQRFNIGERLINYFQNNYSQLKKTLGDSFQMYEDYFEGDIQSLAKEAASQELVRLLSGEELRDPNSRALLSRFAESVKGDFITLNKDPYLQTIKNIDNTLKDRPLSYEDTITPKLERKASSTNRVFRVQSALAYNKKISEKKQEALQKRFEIFKNNPINQDNFRKNNALLMDKFQAEHDLASYEEGNIAFMEEAVGDGITKVGYITAASERLDRLVERMQGGENLTAEDLRDGAALIRNLRTFSDSYKESLQLMIDLPRMIEKGQVEADEQWTESAKRSADMAIKVMAQLEAVEKDAENIVTDLVTEYLRPYFKHKIIWPSGKYKGQEFTIETILSSKDRDIGFFDRFFNSAADSGDIAIQVFDKMIKVASLDSYRQLTNIRHLISTAETKLRDAGITNTKFMFEFDSNGLPTGDLISKEGFSFSKYKDAKKTYKDSLINQGLDSVDIANRMEEWEKDNSEWKQEQNGAWIRIPNIAKYPSNAYKSLNAAQKEYYNSMMGIKEKMDALLPKGKAYKYLAIQKMNTATEAILGNAANAKAAVKVVKGSLGDAIHRREDDDEFGVVSLQDFNGNKIEQIPIYYTDRIKDPSRLSLDFSSSLLAYSAMATHFEAMNKIVDILELGKEVLMKRDIAVTSRGKQLIQSTKSAINNKVYSKKVSTKGANSLSMQRLEDLLTMNVYGKVKNDEGSFNIGKFNVDIAKALDSITGLTSVTVMGGNLFQGLNNLITGTFQMAMEGFAGEYFSMKDIAVADGKYFSLVGDLLAEAGSARNTSMLGLIQEKFNVFQDYGNSKNAEFYKKNLARFFGKGTSPYLLNMIGENWMQTRTLLAYMNAVKLKDKNGATIRLLDAYEKVDIVENGKKVDSRLKLKDGITKEDGTAFTQIDEDDITLKVAKINQFMHGIYNEEDKSAIQKYALGRMAMQFRKWMVPHYTRRYGIMKYDLQLDQFREGYYITAFKAVKNIAVSMTNAKETAAFNWKNLTAHEKANLKRASLELGTFAAMGILLGLVLGDYDDKDTWAGRLMMYQLHRWSLELNTSVPNPYGILKDGLTLLNSPMASLNTFENITELFKFWEAFDVIEEGKYEGHNKYIRNVINNTPMLKQIIRISDLKTEDYMFRAILGNK